MNGKNQHRPRPDCFAPGVLLVLTLVAALSAPGATVWTGPLIAYTQPAPDPTQPANQDRITPHVWLTRATSKGLFNAVTETVAGNNSPADTAWSFGTLDNYATLTYTNWLGWLNGKSPTTMVGSNIVVHLISDDIYVSFKFTSWPAGGSGGFAYQRSTAPVPVVSITAPADGAVFAEPAALTIDVNATFAAGAVTNVQFYSNNTLLGSNTTGPFSLTTGNLAAGFYSLTAVATAAGISATSAVVNVSVVSPASIFLSGATAGNGQFSFTYTANPGLTYIIQNSTDLVNWAALATNVATAGLVPFADPIDLGGAKFYRVVRKSGP